MSKIINLSLYLPVYLELKYKNSMKKILIYNSGGGLGDSIQIIPLILSLKNHYRRSKIFYLGAHPNHFEGKLKEYNIEINTLNLDLRYFGFRWWHLLFVKKQLIKTSEKKFDLIVSNPPYIMRKDLRNLSDDIRRYEPRMALDGGNDGLDLIKKVIYKSK